MKNKSYLNLALFTLLTGCGNNQDTYDKALVVKQINPPYIPHKINRSLSQNELEKIRKDGLEYLNLLRQSAGMIPFKKNAILDDAAQNHAHYLTINNAYGHYESSDKPGFTGVYPYERAIYARYEHRQVGENLASSKSSIYDSIDGLFSAIYHRFGFLSFTQDEIGIGVESGIYNYDMGLSQLSELCKGQSADSGYRHVCANSSFIIASEDYENATATNPNKNPSYILWPPKNQTDAHPVFYNEDPDPLPECEVTGNPISIQFNPYKTGQIALNSFKFFYDKNNTEITNTKLLDKDTDPNQRFTEKQFALYPMDRLQWDTTYKAVINYTEDNTAKSIVWKFKTKKLPLPYYVVDKQNGSYPVKSDQTYLFYLPPQNCHDVSNSYGMSYSGELQVDFSYYDMHTLQIKVTGISGVVNISSNNGKKFKLTISDQDEAIYPNQNDKQTLVLKSGWNLIGANSELTLDTLKQKIGADNLLVIQGPKKSYNKENVDNGLGFLNDFKKFEDGKGYWIKVASQTDINYQVNMPEDITIPLKSGWNLINPTKPLTLSQIKDQIGADNLLLIQGSEKAYKKENIDNGQSFLNDFDKFEEPKGYWIKVKSDSELSF